MVRMIVAVCFQLWMMVRWRNAYFALLATNPRIAIASEDPSCGSDTDQLHRLNQTLIVNLFQNRHDIQYMRWECQAGVLLVVISSRYPQKISVRRLPPRLFSAAGISGPICCHQLNPPTKYASKWFSHTVFGLHDWLNRWYSSPEPYIVSATALCALEWMPCLLKQRTKNN